MHDVGNLVNFNFLKSMTKAHNVYGPQIGYFNYCVSFRGKHQQKSKAEEYVWLNKRSSLKPKWNYVYYCLFCELYFRIYTPNMIHYVEVRRKLIGKQRFGYFSNLIPLRATPSSNVILFN